MVCTRVSVRLGRFRYERLRPTAYGSTSDTALLRVLSSAPPVDISAVLDMDDLEHAYGVVQLAGDPIGTSLHRPQTSQPALNGMTYAQTVIDGQPEHELHRGRSDLVGQPS